MHCDTRSLFTYSWLTTRGLYQWAGSIWGDCVPQKQIQGMIPSLYQNFVCKKFQFQLRSRIFLFLWKTNKTAMFENQNFDAFTLWIIQKQLFFNIAVVSIKSFRIFLIPMMKFVSRDESKYQVIPFFQKIVLFSSFVKKKSLNFMQIVIQCDSIYKCKKLCMYMCISVLPP